MAPITTTTAGIPPQIMDDPEYIELLVKLRAISVPEVLNPENVADGGSGDVAMEEGDGRMLEAIEEFVGLLGRTWRFQELVSFEYLFSCCS